MDDTGSEKVRLASDEVLRLIGRNLLVYQRIEMNLKWLEGNARPITISRTTTENLLAEQVRANHDDVKRNTLGTVLKRVFGFVGPRAGTDLDAHAEDFMVTFSSGLDVQDTPEARKWLGGWQDGLVGARNRLAHGFLNAFDLETVESCEAACRQLDEEHDTALQFLHFTRSVIATRLQGAIAMKDFFESDDFARDLERIFALESFARALEREAESLRRADGWCLFATAVRAVRASQPDTVAGLVSSGEYRTLLAAAEAAQAFQWRKEPTSKGSRLLFRRIGR